MTRLTLAILWLFIVVAMTASPQQSKGPEVVETIDGDPVYKLLEVGGIPAIDEPEFVTGEEADAQMRPEEPVMGILMGGENRAYSMWHLDAHEIVNDSIEGSAIAVTW